MAGRKLYSQLQMADAIRDVRNGCPLATAAKRHGVPRITLRNKIVGKSPKVCTMGPSTVLTDKEEGILEEWVLTMVKRQYPVTRDELQDSVAQLLKELEKKGQKRENPFTDGRPGRKWFNSFLKRHPAITERVPQNLTTARSDISERHIESWFNEIKEYLTSQNLTDVINDPSRVFNSDESAFYLVPKGSRVLAKKGEKVVYSRGCNDEKENLTVLVTGNAAGQLAPPMIVYKYERIPAPITDRVPDGWGIGRSESGWMCSETFYEYMTNVFFLWLKTTDIQLPIIFFMDGHVSHLSLHLAQFCSANGIELICLYANSTHILQPMDVSVFRPLKQFWQKEVRKWRAENEGRFHKEDFAPVLKKAFEHLSTATLTNGFRVCGLCPFEFTKIDFKKLRTHSEKLSNQDLPKKDSQPSVYQQAVHVVEGELPQEKLVLFRSHLDTSQPWSGPIEDMSLFQIWKKLKIKTKPNENIQMTGTPQLDKSSQEIEKRPETDLQNFTQDDLDEVLGGTELCHPLDSLSPLINISPETPTALKLSTILNKEFSVQQLDSRHAPVNDQPSTSRTATSNGLSMNDAHGMMALTNGPSGLQTGLSSDLETSSLHTPQHTTPNMKSNNQPNVPTPFKRALFWPEDKNKQSTKRKKKEKIPSVVTSEQWRSYTEKKRKEKERIENEKIERKLARELKKAEKEQLKQNKLQAKKQKIIKRKRQQQLISSESDCSDFSLRDSDESYCESFSDLEELTSFGVNEYVVVEYEKEHYPGEVKKVKEGKEGTEYQVLTMIMAGVKQWRWPETVEEKRAELCWYKEETVIEKIRKPSTIGKKLYEVSEINRYKK